MADSDYKDCWLIVYYGDNEPEYEYLPMYPDEISDQQGANWSQTQILGRSSPLAAYTGTEARIIGFSITLHREMFKNDPDSSKRVDRILLLLRKALYPNYQGEGKGLIPPRIRMVFGSFAVDGILTNLTYSWKKPLLIDRGSDKKKYGICDVNISISGYPSSVKSADDIYKSNDTDYSPANPNKASISPPTSR